MTYPKKQLTSEQKKQQRLENILSAVLSNRGKWVHLSRYCVTSIQTRRLTAQVVEVLRMMGINFQNRDSLIKVLK